MALSHRSINHSRGQLLVELLLAMALAAIMLPALLLALVTSRQGKAQQQQRLDATTLSKEAYDALRIIREQGWAFVASNGTYYPTLTGNTWTLATGSATIGGFSRYITISDTLRDASGNIVGSGGSPDPSTKKVTITVSWSTPQQSSVSGTYYIVRTDNQIHTEGSYSEFTAGTKTSTQVTDPADGRVKLASNTKGQWCLPSFSSATITLPDGPPVSVASVSDASVTNPNKVFVATSPTSATSIKLAYVTVTANTDPPVATIQGKFTMDSAQYSNASLVPTGTGLDNSFITNKVAYYKSSSNKTYALVATSKPDKEVIAILVDDNDASNNNTNNGEFQDYVNKIYKYKTFFNTRIYDGASSQDQAPYGAGGASLAVHQDRGYVISGGYLYVFNLANIDSKTTSSGLDMVGCRIELDGADCNVATSRVRKYGSGGTGTNFGNESSGLSGCNDGGMVEIFGDNDVYPISVGGNTYAYIAVGAGTDPEFNIVNVTSVPTGGSNPTISNNSCGRITGGNSGWKRISSLDFNSDNNTQETANSVFGKSDGTRAYISSNGTVDADNNGQPDSYQFYVINTSNKSSPAFLSGTPSTGATSGYYIGSAANAQQYPRRSITVFGDSRALLAGIDGVSDSNNAMEYQVLNISSEATPAYCGGIQFANGFNDMSSTVEADGDKYVYLIGSGAGNELKIIQGGPDGPFLEAGTFESAAFDIGSSATFNRFDVVENIPPQTSIEYQVAIADQVSGSCTGANYVFIGSDGTSNTRFATGSAIPLNNDGSGFENPGRCVKYRAYLATTDYNVTPTLLDVKFNFSP
jgi:type II secretory pathway pseudopilin PulG